VFYGKPVKSKKRAGSGDLEGRSMELAIRPEMVPGMAGICDRKLLQLIHKMLV
jgi:hypothetical protein